MLQRFDKKKQVYKFMTTRSLFTNFLANKMSRFGIVIGAIFLVLGTQESLSKRHHVRHVPYVNSIRSGSIYAQENNAAFVGNKTVHGNVILNHAHPRKYLKHLNKKQTVEEDKDMENAVELVSDVATNMDSAGRLKGPLTGNAVSNTIDKVKTKAKKFDKDKRQALANGASEGLDAASGGVIALVQGIQSGSWMDVCMGGLDLISSIAAMMGPAGMMLSTALSMFSMIFHMFGGSSGGEESTGDIVERVLKEALLKQKAEEIEAESAGLKTLYQALSKSISNFRETRNITKQQAIDFYNRAFIGVRFFGELKYYINQWCDIGDIADYAEDEQQDMKDKADRCLKNINLYCDMTILRQLLLLDMVSLIKEIGGPEADSTVDDLRDLLKTEQTSDMGFLRMFVEPLNNKPQRYVTSKYYSAIESYGTLTKYLKKLDELSTEDGLSATRKRSQQETSANKYMKPHVIICEEPILQQGCYKLTKVGDHTKSQLGAWSGKIKSVFVADGLTLTGYSKDNKAGAKFGPMFGPGVYNLRNDKIKIVSLKISESDAEANAMLKVCDKTGMDMEGDCDTYEMGKHSQLYPEGGSIPTFDGNAREGKKNCVFPWVYEGTQYNDCIKGDEDFYWCATEKTSDNEYNYWGKCIFTKNWAAKIESMSIPAGMMVTAYAEEDFKGAKYGPFYGPKVMSTVKPANKWMSLKLEPTEITTTKMVTICENESLGGFCDDLEPKDVVGDVREIPNVSGISGEDWSTGEMKIKSMKVPGGLRVRVFSAEEFGGVEYGPYMGPATITKVDGISGENRIKSLKIERVY